MSGVPSSLSEEAVKKLLANAEKMTSVLESASESETLPIGLLRCVLQGQLVLLGFVTQLYRAICDHHQTSHVSR